MTEALNIAETLFHRDNGLDPVSAGRHIATATDGADDGELFLEYRESESISLDDGRIRAASFDTRRGFGLRAVLGEASYYAHAGEISDAALARAAATIKAAKAMEHAVTAAGPAAAAGRALCRLEPARGNAFRQPRRAAGRDRCVRARRRFPRGAGDGEHRRRVAGGGNPARRRPARRRCAAAGADEHFRRAGGEWPPRIRQPWRRRAHLLRAADGPELLAERGARGDPPGGGES